MDRKKTYEIGLIIVTGLLIIFMLSAKFWIIPLATGIGIIFIFIPPLAILMSRVWTGLAEILGWIVPKLVLSLLWFIILTPLAYVYRLTGHDDLQLNKNNNSHFSDCPKVYSPLDFEKPW